MKKGFLAILIVTVILFVSFSISLMAAGYDRVVYLVQKKLMDLGYDPGQADGVWKDKTELALKQFQRANGMPVTGRPDEDTMKRLGFNVRNIPIPMIISDPSDPNKMFCVFRERGKVIPINKLCFGNVNLGLTPDIVNRLFQNKTPEDRSDALLKFINEKIYNTSQNLSDPLKATFGECDGGQ